MHQSTVSEKAVVCRSDPDVAVTVTIEVTGCGGADEPFEDPPPPHPLSGHKAAALTINSKISWKRDRLFQKTQRSPIARSERGSNGLGPCLRAAAVVDTVIVTVVETGEPDGVTIAGEKLQAVPAGSPEQLNETAASKPLSGVTDIETEPVVPAVKVSDESEAAREKSCEGGVGGGGKLKEAEAIALFV
jgi:hypothetical protein